jgi:hypothetical protein
MKEVPPQGDTIHGHFVPGGTRVGHCFVAMERSEEIFGKDADVFQPGRWLGPDLDKRREMAQVVELVFGHGRWGCAGKPVAIMELNKIFVEVSWNIQIPPPLLFTVSERRFDIPCEFLLTCLSAAASKFQLSAGKSSQPDSIDQCQHILPERHVGSGDGATCGRSGQEGLK